MARVVFDTNVLLSLYVFADSRFAPLRERIEQDTIIALTRDDCLAELQRVLAYPQFSLDQARQDAAYAAYLTKARRPVETRTLSLPRCSDHDDQKFLEVARDGRADALVTSDKALLRLARRKDLKDVFSIVTPERALHAFAEAISGP